MNATIASCSPSSRVTFASVPRLAVPLQPVEEERRVVVDRDVAVGRRFGELGERWQELFAGEVPDLLVALAEFAHDRVQPGTAFEMELHLDRRAPWGDRWPG